MTSEIELIKNAAAGDRDSQFRLGRMYRDGIRIGGDVMLAKWLLQKAVEHKIKGSKKEYGKIKD